MSVTEETHRIEHRPPPASAPLKRTAEVHVAPRKPSVFLKLVRRVVVAAIVLTVLSAGAYLAVNFYLDSRQFESTDDAFIDGHVIPISPQVSAHVLEVAVEQNQSVKKGDVLVRLDPTDYQVILDQKKAIEQTMASRLEEAKTQLEVAKANVGQAQAEVNVSQTQALNMDQDLKRFEGLDPRARSQQQLDNATAQQRMTAATVEQSQAKVTAAQAQASNAQAAVMTAQSDIAKAAADRHQAEIQLGYCTITAPQDGVITRKNVEAGMYLSAGDPMFSIVPSDVWVAANFKETQLNRIRVGQPVDVLVDAYPGKIYHGTLQSIQSGTGSRFTLLPPENATGNYVKVVQRVPVKIVLDAAEMADPARPLSPGMSAIPKIKVAERQNFSEVIREWFKG